MHPEDDGGDYVQHLNIQFRGAFTELGTVFHFRCGGQKAETGSADRR